MKNKRFGELISIAIGFTLIFVVYQPSRYYHNDNNKMIISHTKKKVNIFILKILKINILKIL